MQTKIIPRFEASIAPTDTDSINVWLGRSTSLPGAWRIVQMELDLHKGGAVLARTQGKSSLTVMSRPIAWALPLSTSTEKDPSRESPRWSNHVSSRCFNEVSCVANVFQRGGLKKLPGWLKTVTWIATAWQRSWLCASMIWKDRLESWRARWSVATDLNQNGNNDWRGNKSLRTAWHKHPKQGLNKNDQKVSQIMHKLLMNPAKMTWYHVGGWRLCDESISYARQFPKHWLRSVNNGLVILLWHMFVNSWQEACFEHIYVYIYIYISRERDIYIYNLCMPLNCL